jgi:imidazolonepropionase-like amidohydrolase
VPEIATGRTVFRGGLVFDGSGAEPARADVAIEGALIREIGQDLVGETVVDISGATLMPGLIDCHAHPAFPAPFSTLDEDVDRSASYVAYEALAPLRATLDAGFTTVRDAAGADAGLRRALADGLIQGPRLVISLLQLSPSAGPYDGRTPSGHDTWIARPGIPSPVADGPDALRAKVRQYAQAGADVIKIFASGHFAMPHDGAMRSMFTDDELRAIVDEAARQGLMVMAHAHGPIPAAAAARAGAASIEHGFFLDQVALDAMHEAGTVFVPTLLASAGMLALAGDAGKARAEASVRAHREAVRAAHRMNIPIALGTDCPVTPHGRNAEELALLVDCGLSPWEALAAGTTVAARLLGLEAEIGSVQVGRHADLLVVDGDLGDVGGLSTRLRDVYQRGVRVGPTRSA